MSHDTSSNLPHPPRVVTTINNADDLAFARTADLPSLCDVLEIRLDGLQETPLELSELQSLHATTPLILTARREDEGAFSPMSDAARIDAIHQTLLQDAMVDLEFRTLNSTAKSPALTRLLEAMKNNGNTIVMSYHDFNGVPDEAQIRDHLACAREHRAITKIAATVNSTTQLQLWTERLAQLECSNQRFSFMGMGKFGMATRLIAASAGSELNYGFIQSASVPGQWPAKLLKATIAKLS
ncbi:type I 3-dehydroquinate dehydratase [Sulfuriroseicoccus oceanibius]|uniref:3-dehydroquinate dehydratase n=1 Tax=Sulfuriroseicoccus oceanibius TaxID=2707525 RepID=A0A6B3LBK7_9BACT|nr:type I 3-dehydroquinate dehydratase [Sulfuriroseicoccus oceanibius]QQL44519.1 type I 3-dehydroquinate dehydratase [Sulfuriroseicoccus oceanibius]